MSLRPRQNVEGERQKPIAGQNRGGFVEGLVSGGAAAPQCIVVHRRQVVVHQRITVHTFERRRDHHGLAPGRAKQRRAFDHQKRTQPFAAARMKVLVDGGNGFDRSDRLQTNLLLHKREIRPDEVDDFLRDDGLPEFGEHVPGLSLQFSVLPLL